MIVRGVRISWTTMARNSRMAALVAARRSPASTDCTRWRCSSASWRERCTAYSSVRPSDSGSLLHLRTKSWAPCSTAVMPRESSPLPVQTTMGTGPAAAAARVKVLSPSASGRWRSRTTTSKSASSSASRARPSASVPTAETSNSATGEWRSTARTSSVSVRLSSMLSTRMSRSTAGSVRPGNDRPRGPPDRRLEHPAAPAGGTGPGPEHLAGLEGDDRRGVVGAGQGLDLGGGLGGRVPPRQVHQAGVVGEHLDHWLADAEPLLEALGLPLLVPQHQAHGHTGPAGPGGAARAVEVGLVV